VLEIILRRFSLLIGLTRLNKKTAEREQALSLLRELYRDISELDQPDLLQKVEKIAAILKNSQ